MAPTWLKAPIYGAEPYRGKAAILTNCSPNVPRTRSASLQRCKVLPNSALLTDAFHSALHAARGAAKRGL